MWSYFFIERSEWDNFDQLYARAEIAGGALAERHNAERGDGFDPNDVAAAARDTMKEFVKRMYN